MKTMENNCHKRGIRFVLLTLFNIWTALYALILAINSYRYIRIFAVDYSDWNLSEFLVNYAGGFTRRGLLGEILFKISDATGAPPHYLIFAICLICFLAVAVPFIKLLLKYNIWWWILPASICFGSIGMNFIRKDYIVIALGLLCFLIYNRADIKAGWKLLLITIITLVALNIHESSFFLFAAFLWLTIFRDKTFRIKKIYKIISFGAVILCMSILFYTSGNGQMPYSIQLSWNALFPNNIGPELSPTVSSMSWTILDSLKFNDSILLQFSINPPGEAALNMLNWLYLITVGIYLMSRYPYSAIYGRVRRFPIEMNLFTAILILEFIFLLPLFLGLSCDFGRLLSQIFISSFFIAAMFPKDRLQDIIPNSLQHVVASINTAISRIIPNNIYIMMFLLLLYHATFCRFAFNFFHQITYVIKNFNSLTTLF